MLRLKRKSKKLLVCIIGAMMVCLLLSPYLGSDFDERQVPAQGAVEHALVSEVWAAREFVQRTPPQPATFYNYNRKLSDRIGAFRALPDPRESLCTTRTYRIARHLSRVSVVIVFHNEARSILLRTMLSLSRRTPGRYLHELILLDDASTDASLLADLMRLNFPPFGGGATATTVRVHRNRHRLGLIASRNTAAQLATGDLLFFLDSHCEVNAGWLEPLLERMAASKQPVAVSPVLDSIDALTLEYRASSRRILGGFDWALHFRWLSRTDKTVAEGSSSAASASPAFAGGIFLIARQHFLDLGGFHPQLEIWGGESIELSLKLWLCGGRIELVPCSRVGHIFRRRHPFQFPQDDSAGQTTYLRNSKIIAESWLGAYKHFFYALKPEARDLAVNWTQPGHEQLKRRLHCRSFGWYLQNVYPELRLPHDDYSAFGTLSASGRCLQIVRTAHSSSNNNSNSNRHNQSASAHAIELAMVSCYESSLTLWYLHRDQNNGRLTSSSGACLGLTLQSDAAVANVSASARYKVGIQYCRDGGRLQRWRRRGAQLVHKATQLCLDNPLGDVVAMSHCRPKAVSQLFRFSVELERL